jgi:hypothetical protein
MVQKERAMRHERLLDESDYNKVDVAALWPSGTPLAPAPIPDLMEAKLPAVIVEFVPTPAAPDVPAAVGAMVFAAYLSLIGAFALATAGSAESIFVITISALFVVTYFTVPRIFLGLEPKGGDRPGLAHFMQNGMHTLTGHCSGRDALVQMLIVPVLLTFAALAMGVAVAVFM